MEVHACQKEQLHKEKWKILCLLVTGKEAWGDLRKKMRGDIMKGLLYSVLECELVENNLEILGRGVT